MKTIYTVMGIIAAAALLSTFVASNAFAIQQNNLQLNAQLSGQSQSGISVLSPQTTGQAAIQTSVQAACTALANVICG